ncbi:uncharacterized protein LOC34618079 [Cyclospora cayetanensis]|uniref:Uncharacterized protein LOC34618079 n=1 Tax=Cyclospora cayetanensis TaxID=88456 RepID=A0A6P5WDE0_9EIME|nr:uncharacterized protein LOC34618079 [Cyclospora cayetanensis]
MTWPGGGVFAASNPGPGEPDKDTASAVFALTATAESVDEAPVTTSFKEPVAPLDSSSLLPAHLEEKTLVASQKGLPAPADRGPQGATRRRASSPGLLVPCSAKLRSRSNSLSPSPSRRRRRVTTANSSVCKINVGPKFQAPYLPPFFLTADEGESSLSAEDLEAPALDIEGESPNGPRLVYSAGALLRVAAARTAAAATVQEGSTTGCGKICTGLSQAADLGSFVGSEEDLDRYLAHAAASWAPSAGSKVREGLPFSPEFALQLLHVADYNPEKALNLLRQPGFNLQKVCEAPLRRYDNKWRPKDRRGLVSGVPYPPAQILKTYVHRWHRHKQEGSHSEALYRAGG